MGQDNSVQHSLPTKPANNTPLTDSQWDFYSQTKSIKSNKPETLLTHTFKSQHSWTQTTNYISYIQTIRHPNIIKFSASNCIPNERLELRTYPILPLRQFLPHCSRPNATQGIRELATALNFLHNSAKASHLGLAVGEVFVDMFNGCWLLGGFGLTRKLTEVEESYIFSLEKFSLMKTGMSNNEITELENTGYDVWLFKVFIDDVIEITKFHSLLEDLLDWMDTNWHELRFDDILNHETLNTSVTDTIEILTNISVMDQQEKSLFIESLPSRLLKLDETILAFRIAQLIFSTHLYMDRFVSLNIIPSLLIPKSNKFKKEVSNYQRSIQNALISEDIFKQFIVPLIMRLFTKQELQLRILLLKYFKYYIYLFTYQQQTQMHSYVLLGLRDSREELAKLTFFALGELTSYMGVHGVTGQEVRPIFADLKPRDYQVSVPDDDVIVNEDILSDARQPNDEQRNVATQQADSYASDFFENETKQATNAEFYTSELINEENLLSEIKKPKFLLGRRDELLSQSDTVDELVELPIETHPHRQTLLELSQMSYITNEQTENGGDYLTDTGLDSPPVQKKEKGWEDWDPF